MRTKQELATRQRKIYLLEGQTGVYGDWISLSTEDITKLTLHVLLQAERIQELERQLVHEREDRRA